MLKVLKISLMFRWIPIPDKEHLEFLPSISKVQDGHKWKNMSWTEYSEYKFNNLEPFTQYNMTVYVRVKGTKTVFPPERYFDMLTGEGIPSAPWNVTVQQQNGSHVLISWKAPDQPKGIIQNYEVCWYPPLPPIKLTLSDNGTSHLLTGNFQLNNNYSFYVIAHNRLHESKPSEIKSLIFDLDVEPVTNLKVEEIETNSAELIWDYSKKYDGFKITILVTYDLYSFRANKTANTTKTIIDNLSPGTEYTVKVSAYRGSYIGEPVVARFQTKGAVLPGVLITKVEVINMLLPSVKLTWEIPLDKRDVKWVYGVYYGINNEFLGSARVNTTKTSIVVTDLDACEKYYFSVGIIGPIGIGPLAHEMLVATPYNERSPPKDISVETDLSDDARMIIKWASACRFGNVSVAYEIGINETKSGKYQSFTTKKSEDVEWQYPMDIMYGGVYQVKVRAALANAMFSNPIDFWAPRLETPIDFTVVPENDSFVVNWTHSESFRVLENYTFEVLVSDGGTLDPGSAKIYELQKPPFIFKDVDHNKIYTFGVRVKTHSNLRSEMALSSSQIPSSSNSTPVLVAVFILMTILIIAFAILGKFTNFSIL